MSREGVLVKIAVRKIIDDLSDRKGLKQEWKSIERYIQREIIETWEDIVMDAIVKATE